EGFQGGMTAKKYMAIAKTCKASPTRDLQHLNEIGALQVLGAGRSVRYELVFEVLKNLFMINLDQLLQGVHAVTNICKISYSQMDIYVPKTLRNKMEETNSKSYCGDLLAHDFNNFIAQ